MRPAAVHRMLPPVPAYGEPLVLFEQKPARKTVGFILVALILVLLVLYSPFYMLMSGALADSGIREIIAERPRALAQILAGFGVWLFFIGSPIYFLFDTLTRSRRVQIAQGMITVTDRAFGFTKTWQAALSDFMGLRQTMRAFVSGVRHELILEHTDKKRSILLLMSHNPNEIDGAKVAQDLNTSFITTERVAAPQTSPVKMLRTASA